MKGHSLKNLINVPYSLFHHRAWPEVCIIFFLLTLFILFAVEGKNTMAKIPQGYLGNILNSICLRFCNKTCTFPCSEDLY